MTTFQRRQYSQVSSQGGRCQENASGPHPRTPEDGIDDDDDAYGKLAIDHRGKCDKMTITPLHRCTMIVGRTGMVIIAIMSRMAMNIES